MAKAGEEQLGSRETVRQGLSEIRTTVLGPQILLGFQYHSLFQPGFAKLEPWRQSLSLASLGLLFATVMLVLAPTSFHQIAETGQRSVRQAAFTEAMLAWSLGPFALAIGVNLLVVGSGQWGVAAAAIAGAAATGLCLLLWYGVEAMIRAAASPAAREIRASTTSLRDQVSDLMTETRIVLPGVQALLGFQFAAYLTNTLPKLPSDVRTAHDAGLALLLLSMIFLMTPAPFHRLAARGQDTRLTCQVGAACIVAALSTLALGLAADVYVAIAIITGSGAAAWLGAIVGALAALGIWFVVPLIGRTHETSTRRSREPRAQG